MQEETKKIFIELLEIIHYTDDKEEFIKDFFSICQNKLLDTIVTSLPEDKQREFQQKTMWAKDIHRVQDILLEFITKETFEKTYEEIVTATFQDFLETIGPTVTPEQSKKIDTLLASLAHYRISDQSPDELLREIAAE